MIGKLAPLFGSLCLFSLLIGAGLFASARIDNASQGQAMPENVELPDVAELPEKLETQIAPERPDIYYEAITARPLFSPTRRPTEVASEIVSEPEPNFEPSIITQREQPNVALGGILGSIDERKALILFGEAPAKWLSLGDDVEGWEITEINDKAITLSSDTRTFRLELFQ